ncbi:MAG: hypothetical protein ACXVEE_35955 [Polyangiales bacterium]
MRWLWPLAVVVLGCSLETDERHAGTGAITGDLENLALACDSGVSIARSFPPSLEIKIARGGVSCETVQSGDRVTIDLGDASPGTYTVVTGYPQKAKLSAAQARAHACSADTAQPCHDLVRSGSVTVTRLDPDIGGIVEGTFELDFADGNLTGSFAAVRCN